MTTRASAGLFALALACSLAVGTHGLVYWDAGDYVVLALGEGPSGLLLGRPAFLLVSRAIVRAIRAAGATDAFAEPVLRWAWSLVAAMSAPLLAILATRVGAARAPALMAGFALATSATFAHTSHQVLTDGAALTASFGALIAATYATLRAAAVAGLCLGLAVATRETAVVHGLAVAMLVHARTGRRGVLVACAMASLVTAGLVLQAHGGSPSAVAAWFSAMRRSSSTHGLSLREVAISLGWLFAMGPVGVVLGVRALGTARGDLRIVTYPAAAATLLLLFYPDGSFSPRYLLATAPIALLLPAAEGLASMRRLAYAAAALGAVVALVATAPARAVARRGAALGGRVAGLPPRTTLVPGHYCPHARLALAVAKRTDLTLVCPGWDWPTDPAATLSRALAEGRPVAVDPSDEAWIGPRERAPRDAVRAFVASRASRPMQGFAVLDP